MTPSTKIRPASLRALLSWAFVVLLGCASASAQTTWLEARLPNVTNVAMAFDTRRARVVLFGGIAGNYTLANQDHADTWEWDGRLWIQRSPATRPPARSSHAMAYDVARGKVVLFGGMQNNAGFLGDTWEWDGIDWTRMSPAPQPPPRAEHAMVYDFFRGRVVLFGGGMRSGYADTWEWDGIAWVQRSPSSKPPARTRHSMAYDFVRARVVMFGGWYITGWPNGTITSVFADTWEFDGSTWSLRGSAGTAPKARVSAAMSYDMARSRVVLFGGDARAIPTGSTYLSDTWEWDGSIWTARTLAASPSARFGHAMAYDWTRARHVVFGGHVRSDTWEFDGNNWNAMRTSASPPAAAHHAMAYDALRRRVVLFGGEGITIDPFADTYEWDGTEWLWRGAVSGPSGRSGHAMAYDVARGRVVLFGGALAGGTMSAETWEWDGVSWIRRASASSPSARWHHAMAYDVLRGRVVLYGGQVGNTPPTGDTWEWDGNNWLMRSPATQPGPRWGHVMAYDLLRGRTVLVAGTDYYAYLGDTWEWDGNDWSFKASPTGPSGRMYAALAYDIGRARTVLFGGYDGTGEVNDVWEWDGQAWAVNPAFPSSLGRRGSAMAYDLARDEIVLFGGRTVKSLSMFGESSDTWRRGRASSLIPAAVAAFGQACAGSNGPPRLGVALPLIGSQGFVVDLLGLASSPCSIGLAMNTKTAILGGGCSYYLDAPLATFSSMTNASGFASVQNVVPNDPSLRGGLVYAQGFVVDAQGAFAGLAFTSGLKLTLGY
jgi:hypothetical protein